MLKPELLYLVKLYWIFEETQQSIDKGLSTFELHYFTMLGSREWGDVLEGCVQARLGMHFDAVIQQVWGYTGSLYSIEIGGVLACR
jgi:hypothetical protein